MHKLRVKKSGEKGVLEKKISGRTTLVPYTSINVGFSYLD